MITEVKPISKREFSEMVYRFHYSKVLPKLTKLFLGGFEDGELVAVMSLGWGVRPLHTIRRLFPSLTTKDYYEIGKMCLPDSLPHNSESKFISLCMRYVRDNFSKIKLIFTWADGMLGKPGYIYQASNFLYGGYAVTDSYFTDKGEKVHPRTTGSIGGRPNKKEQVALGFKHYKGRQFRYVYFLCSRRERKELLGSSGYAWEGGGYPKDCDLKWLISTKDGWVDSGCPDYRPEERCFRRKNVDNLSPNQIALV